MGPVLARGAVMPQGQMTGMSQNTMTRRLKRAQATEEEFRNLTGARDHVFRKEQSQFSCCLSSKWLEKEHVNQLLINEAGKGKSRI